MGIDKDKRQQKQAAELRRRAEKQLQAKTAEEAISRTDDETQRLLHELQVHQIELEMQNAELRQARVEVETALERYTDLYDFAPVGFFTLDRDGAVRAANLAGAGLLGIERNLLIGRRFEPLVTVADRPVFTEFLRKVFENRAKEACEVAFREKGKRPLFVQIEALATVSATECRIAIIDISARREAEEASRVSELHYRSLFENMLNGFAYCKMLFDGTGRPEDFIYLAVNSAFERLTGLKNVAGKKVTEAIPGIKESHPELFEIYGRVALTGRTETFELEFKPSGTWLFISVYSPERECFVAVFDNITAHKQAEEVLRESERRYSSLFNNRHVPMLLIDPETGKILNANPAACSLYGYSCERFADLKISDINTLSQQDILGRMGQALGEEGSLFHFRHRLANGEIRDVEVYSGPIEIRERKLLYSIVHDISERTRMEAELLKSEHQLAEAQRIAHLGSWEWDSIVNEITGSDEFYHIFGGKFSSYESFIELVHPDDRDKVNRSVRDTLDHLKPYNVYYRIMRPDGIILIVQAQGKAVTCVAGTAVGMIGTAQDVTKRQRAEDALAERQRQIEELNRTLEDRIAEAVAELRLKDEMLILQDRLAVMGEMINNIAHQWRQPLNMLGLIVQHLQLAYGTEEFSREFLTGNTAKGLELIRHMSRTIDDFRNFFRSDKEVVVFSVNQVIGQTVFLIEKSFQDQNICIAHRAESEPMVSGYPNEFAQVLLNILMNARDALVGNKVDDARIALHVCAEGGKTVITITDNAGGIAGEIIDRLFDPYFTTKEPDKGTGIGLFMSKTIIEKNMGGRLTVRNIGNGAEFRIEV